MIKVRFAAANSVDMAIDNILFPENDIAITQNYDSSKILGFGRIKKQIKVTFGRQKKENTMLMVDAELNISIEELRAMTPGLGLTVENGDVLNEFIEAGKVNSVSLFSGPNKNPTIHSIGQQLYDGQAIILPNAIPST